MYISPLIKTSANCTMPHLHVVDGVGVVVDGSDGSDVETAGHYLWKRIQYNMQGKVNKYIHYTV